MLNSFVHLESVAVSSFVTTQVTGLTNPNVHSVVMLFKVGFVTKGLITFITGVSVISVNSFSMHLQTCCAAGIKIAYAARVLDIFMA